MMRKKRLVSLILAMAMLGLSACGNVGGETAKQTQKTAEETTHTAPQAQEQTYRFIRGHQSTLQAIMKTPHTRKQ